MVVLHKLRRLFVDSELCQNQARTLARPPFIWERSELHITEETFSLWTNVAVGLLKRESQSSEPGL